MTTPAVDALRALPSVHAVLTGGALVDAVDEFGETAIANDIRTALAEVRHALEQGEVADQRGALIERIVAKVQAVLAARRLVEFDAVINATGVVLHTNLGRAPLADDARAALAKAARCTNVELDLDSGERRRRGHQVDRLLRDLTGAEAALVVNNCAAATLLALQATAAGREVVVSRGQLIEIGGSYRLPDVFAMSGVVMKEVGTTNRTHLADYEQAIGPDTAALLRVHPSNFRVVGFAAAVELPALVKLARQRGLLAIDDVGSGALIDLRPLGLPAEPLVQDSIAAGTDLVIFSGDKLLGGPQCGIVLGRKSIVERLESSPLARALRVDKLTLAALQATLAIHCRGKATAEIPTLAALATPLDLLEERARALAEALRSGPAGTRVEVAECRSAVGGGSLPIAELPSWCLRLVSPGRSSDQLARRLRTGRPRVVARIERDAVVIDVRTVLPSETAGLATALVAALGT